MLPKKASISSAKRRRKNLSPPKKKENSGRLTFKERAQLSHYFIQCIFTMEKSLACEVEIIEILC